jgi:hypothetical protein
VIESNPYTRASILAGATVKRLQREGVSAEDAKRLVVHVINSEEADMTRQRRQFDEVRITERLKRLPATE